MGGNRWVVAERGPELATIGTGDILAGMIATFGATGQDAETDARFIPNPTAYSLGEPAGMPSGFAPALGDSGSAARFVPPGF